MKILNCESPSFLTELNTLCQRSAFTEATDKDIIRILNDVRENGDRALIKYAKKFDGVELVKEDFPVNQQELEEAEEKIEPKMQEAIQVALRNISIFSKQRIPQAWTFSPRKGVQVGEKFEPFSRIAAYIPGGRFPLVSTVIHTIGLAKAAGVKEIVITTPIGPSKKVHPAILYAAAIAGATEIYKLGGVYAIGALAYGTESIKKVEKIVGPGNSYVTAAKKTVYGSVALDLVAGPSEIVIIADETANPVFIAADMLAQAEHGSGLELVALVTNSDEILDKVKSQLEIQAACLANKSLINVVLKNGTFLIKTKDLEQAVSFTNRFAPEHLEIMTKNSDEIAAQITAAGAIFIGSWTPEPIGDYLAGPSHVLPTGGSGKFFSGLTVEQFFRRISTTKYDKKALEREADMANLFSKMEGLEAHGRSVSIRVNQDRACKEKIEE